MHPGRAPKRYQAGDPGRYLFPGLYQELLGALAKRRINPAYGYSIILTNPETGETGRVTGISTHLIGVEHMDEGSRDLGTFVSETGHFAFADMALCVEPNPCDQCRWIGIDEQVVARAGPGLLEVEGSIMHFCIKSARPKAATTLSDIRKAA